MADSILMPEMDNESNHEQKLPVNIVELICDYAQEHNLNPNYALIKLATRNHKRPSKKYGKPALNCTNEDFSSLLAAYLLHYCIDTHKFFIDIITDDERQSESSPD